MNVAQIKEKIPKPNRICYHLGLLSFWSAIAMKVNHLNLTVTDPVETQQFLVKHFGLKPRGKGNQNMALLSDDNGMVLTLMNVKGRESEVKYPATFHIGFIQDSEE